MPRVERDQERRGASQVTSDIGLECEAGQGRDTSHGDEMDEPGIRDRKVWIWWDPSLGRPLSWVS